jgi:hypothetical protein
LRRSYGLPAAMLRHSIVFSLALGAIIAQGITSGVPVDSQFVSWAAVAGGVGALSALIARRLLGLVFLVAGAVVGMLVLFVVNFGDAASVSSAIGSVGLYYLKVVDLAALTYLLTAIVLRRLRRE